MSGTVAACIKPRQHGIYDIIRIERMLNGFKQNVVSDDLATLFEDALRFGGDGSYFKNYN